MTLLDIQGKKKNSPYHLRVYNLLGDQELEEGKTEAEIRQLGYVVR